jgi:hypothetical protein
MLMTGKLVILKKESTHTMGFSLYRKLEHADGIVRLEHLCNLKLSGTGGILERSAAASPSKTEQVRAISAAELSEMAGHDPECLLLFTAKAENGEAIPVSRVLCIYLKVGLVHSEVLIEQEALSDVEWDGPDLAWGTLPPQSPNGRIVESLRLFGGYSKLRHTWKLGPAPMGMGAVIRNSA